LQRNPDDVIHTTRFTISGRIEPDALEVRTGYFGKASVKLTDLRELLSDHPGRVRNFTIAAASYSGPMIQWMETEVTATRGRKLKITATGEVDLNPNQPGNFMANPKGPTRNNRIGWNPGSPPPGELLGRIGKDGKEFSIGTEFEAEAKEAGKLFLRISPGPWGVAATGEYKVTVTHR
jgi:hypothetical protein